MTGIQNVEGVGLTVIVMVPLKDATIGERGNLIPFVRPEIETKG